MTHADLIYDSKHIRVVGRKGSSNFGLITFSPATQVANGLTFWADAVAEKGDLTTIGIVGHSANWFPVADIEAASMAIKMYMSGFSKIIGYGSSMGGYGAIKFSNILGITHSISFAPQWSISPDDVGLWDKRFCYYYSKDLHSRCAISRDDIVSKVFIFYDSFFEIDARNTAEILKICPDVHEFRMPLTGHFPVSLFRGTAQVLRLFNNVLAGDVNGIRRDAHVVRRDPKTALRARYLAEMLADDHMGRHARPERSAMIYEQYKDKFTPDDAFSLHHKLAGAFLRDGDYDKAAYHSDLSLIQRDHRDIYVRRSMLEVKRHRLDDALSWARRGVEKWPGLSTRIHLVDVLIWRKEFDKASQEITFIIEDDPINEAALRRALRIEVAINNVQNQVRILKILMKSHPKLSTFLFVGDLLKNPAHRHTVAEAFRLAWELDPKNPSLALKCIRAYIDVPHWGKASQIGENAAKIFCGNVEILRALEQAYAGIG